MLRRTAVLLLLTLFGGTSALTTAVTYPITRPAALRRAAVPQLRLEDSEDPEEEEHDPLEEDWDPDVSWQRLRLEGLASEWFAEMRLEALEGLPVVDKGGWRTRVEELSGILVAILAFGFLLKTYMLHSGGGIIIVPDDGPFGHIYNFEELKNLAPERLMKLGLPAAAPPPAAARPLMRFGGLLLLSGTDLPPPG